MVESILTQEMIDSGASLVKKIDENSLQPVAVFWFYFPDRERWKLVIADVNVGIKGPREIYKKLQNILRESPDELKFSLEDITLVSPDTHIVTLLSHAIKTGTGISGIRFRQNVINGTMIDDAYIYRLNVKKPALQKKK